MRGVGAFGLTACACLALAVACGGTQPPVRRAPAARPRVEPAPPPPPAAPSTFEKKWSSACKEGGAVGQCPAPFDHPAVFVDVGDGEHAALPLCDGLEARDGTQARDALATQHKALAACFRGAEPGTFVELGQDGAIVSDPARPHTARLEGCVGKLVKRAFSGMRGAKPERLVVLRSAPAKPGDQVLSKESLDAVVNDHATEINTCYDAALEVWPGLKGRVVTTFVIWFDGRVALAKTHDSTLGNPMLECCINTAIHSWTFAKPKDGSIALVSFPFVLGPTP